MAACSCAPVGNRGECPQLQRHGDDHALAEIADRGREQRPLAQLRIGLQLGHVLVASASNHTADTSWPVSPFASHPILDHRCGRRWSSRKMPCTVTAKSAGISPASTSGRSVAMAPCGQQPGLATRLAVAIHSTGPCPSRRSHRSSLQRHDARSRHRSPWWCRCRSGARSPWQHRRAGRGSPRRRR